MIIYSFVAAVGRYQDLAAKRAHCKIAEGNHVGCPGRLEDVACKYILMRDVAHTSLGRNEKKETDEQNMTKCANALVNCSKCDGGLSINLLVVYITRIGTIISPIFCFQKQTSPYLLFRHETVLHFFHSTVDAGIHGSGNAQNEGRT